MPNFVSEKAFLRGVLRHYFNMKEAAAESHRILVEVYGEHALAERTCQKWFARFKSGDFDLEDEERPGQPKKFEDEELEAIFDEHCCQTQEEPSFACPKCCWNAAKRSHFCIGLLLVMKNGSITTTLSSKDHM